jgi:hypothetical protein
MRPKEIKKLLKSTFPSLGMFSDITFLDPRYQVPDHNWFVNEYKSIWIEELTELKNKAMSLEWIGFQCEDFAQVSIAEIKKRRLKREKDLYYPYIMGRMIGEHMSFQKWYGHSWGFVITSNGLYCLNYENITNDFKRFKPRKVTA